MRPCRQLRRSATNVPVVCITALLASLLWLPLASAPADAQDEAASEDGVRETPRIYKWIDENGIAHYTTDRSRIPAGLQERFDQLGSAPPPLEREAASATAPSAAPADGTGAAAAAATASTRRRRTSADSFDTWASRNRSSVERDAWDEGEFENEVVDVPRVLSAEELAAIEAERVEIDQLITALEAEVAASEDFLKEWVSVAGTTPLDREDDGSFQSAARLLPEQLAELAALRQRRDALETP
ncbi:MAG: hypothetical protein QNK05_13840 [Myxococcota bacterium]|nr:hypothetical protein [Myxococcota bacterium]